jgi:hypothetical protein
VRSRSSGVCVCVCVCVSRTRSTRRTSPAILGTHALGSSIELSSTASTACEWSASDTVMRDSDERQYESATVSAVCPIFLSALGIRNLFSAFLSSGSPVAAVSLGVTTSRAAVTEHCGYNLDAYKVFFTHLCGARISINSLDKLLLRLGD